MTIEKTLYGLESRWNPWDRMLVSDYIFTETDPCEKMVIDGGNYSCQQDKDEKTVDSKLCATFRTIIKSE